MMKVCHTHITRMDAYLDGLHAPLHAAFTAFFLPHTWMDGWIPACQRMNEATATAHGWTANGCVRAKEIVPAVDWTGLDWTGAARWQRGELSA
jgi:hypothetical protein